MKKKKKFNTGGIVSGGSNDPLQNILLQQYSNLIQNPTHIENPNAALTRNNIATAKAMQEANSNPWTQGLDILGNMAMSYGMNMMSSGATDTTSSGGEVNTEGFTGFLNGLMGSQVVKQKKANNAELDSMTITPGNTFQKLAFGGKTGMNSVEVEGQEVGQLPNGQLLDFKGPSHEAGGINTILPDATTIFSKRIKIDGKTMAERKKAREKQANKLAKLQKDNVTDTLLKNAIERTKVTTKAEDAFDLQLQGEVAKLFGDENKNLSNTNNFKKFQGGTDERGILSTGNTWQQMLQQMFQTFGQGQQGVIPNMTGTSADYHTPVTGAVDYSNPFGTETMQELVINVDRKKPETETSTALPVASNTDTPNEGFKLNQAGLPTFGDALGIYGNLKQARDLKNLTLENRAGDTPNINAFENFGKDALNTLQGSKNYVAGVRDENIRDLNTARAGSVGRNRNSARGINTLRALDLATDSQVNQSLNDLYSTFANQMLGILGQEAQMEMQQDQVVMGGEQARDLADRQDRDAFYTNLSRNQQAIGEALSRTGKNVNQIKERGTNQNFLNMLSDYFDIDVANGTMKPKKNVTLSVDASKAFENFVKDKEYSDDYSKKEWDALSKEEQEKYYRLKKSGK